MIMPHVYKFKIVKQEIIKRGYILHIPQKRKREKVIKDMPEKQHEKRYPARGCWIVERTNS